jgi:phage baseplate assembly protein V
MLRNLHKLLDPVRRAVRLLLTRGVLRLVADDATLQRVQVTALAGETLDGLERWQDYGITSVPHPGAEVLVGSVGGNRSHAVVLRVDDRRYRLRALEEGEVALYTDEGDVIHLARGRRVRISTLHLHIDAAEDVAVQTTRYAVTASEAVEIVTPSLTARAAGGGASVARFEGAVHVVGDVTTDADVRAQGVSLRGHVHPENDGGGPTDPPQES